MIDHEMTLLLIGAAIALVSSIVTALIEHFLALRSGEIKPLAAALSEAGGELAKLEK